MIYFKNIFVKCFFFYKKLLMDKRSYNINNTVVQVKKNKFMNNYESINSSVSNTVNAYPRGNDALRNLDKNPARLIYDLYDLMDIFRVSRRTLFNWREKGILPMFIIGERGKSYISHEMLMQFINQKEGGIK